MTSTLTRGLRRKPSSSRVAILPSSSRAVAPGASTVPIRGMEKLALPSSSNSPDRSSSPNTVTFTRSPAPRR